MADRFSFYSLILSMTALSGCARSAPQYPNNQKKDNIGQQALEEILCPAVKVDVEGTFEIKFGNTALSGTFSGPRGSGVAVYDDESKKSYVFTARHVINDNVINEEVLPGLVLRYTSTVKEIKVNGYTAVPVRKNKLYDIGMLEIQGGTLPCHFKGKLAQKVEVGDLVAVVGYPAMEEKTLALGYVASEKLGTEVYLDVYEIFGVPQRIVADVSLAPGSSGSPVYVFKGGKPYLGGMIQVLYHSKPGFGFVPVEVLRGLVKGTPLSDELLEE